MIYRVVPCTSVYSGLTWSVERKSFPSWWEEVDAFLTYENAVETVERMIKHNGGMWEATAKRKV
jgi:hypothetical protein